MGEMISINAAKCTNEDTFTCSLISEEREGNADRSVEILHAPSHPLDEVVENFFSSSAKYVANVTLHERPIPRYRINCQASKHVEHVALNLERTARFKYGSAPDILPPIDPIEPMAADFDF